MDTRLKNLVILTLLVSVAIIGTLTFANAASFSSQGTDPLPTLPGSDQEYKVYKNPEDYHIVYLIDTNSVSSDSLLSPLNSMGEITKADVATKWSEVLEAEAATPVEALIIHKSAVAVVDTEWVAKAVRRGMALITINMHPKEQAALRMSNCDLNKPEVNNPVFDMDGYFLATVHLIITVNPAELETAIGESYNDCKISDKIEYNELASFTQGVLQDEGQIMYLTNVMINFIDDIRAIPLDPKNSTNSSEIIPLPTASGN